MATSPTPKTVAILEARTGAHLAELVSRQGAVPLLAPALEEVPDVDPAAVEMLLQDWIAHPFRMMIFQTGVGTRALFRVTDSLGSTPKLLRLLEQATVVVRGPKPTGELKARGVRIDLRAASPFTSETVMAAIAASPLTGARVVVQRYGEANRRLCEALTARGTGADIDGRIADIRDRERIMRLMAEFKPDILFHAAALKHVPILERDWDEGVKTNVFGSLNVADAAVAAGAAAMVMISTDKAIEPVSVLGATKRFAEMYCQALDADLSRRAQAGHAPMRLIAVRFGNVLASNGSVVPKFKAQIDAGGPVTVTHPDMVRYFMTIREACDLVVTAATHALGPTRSDVSVYVLNMGQPVKIVDLAERMIRLAGLAPGTDIKIAFTGTRPGERMHEVLFARGEPTVDIGFEGVVAARPAQPSLDVMRGWLALLDQGLAREEREAIYRVLRDAVPDFQGAAA